MILGKSEMKRDKAVPTITPNWPLRGRNCRKYTTWPSKNHFATGNISAIRLVTVEKHCESSQPLYAANKSHHCQSLVTKSTPPLKKVYCRCSWNDMRKNHGFTPGNHKKCEILLINKEHVLVVWRISHDSELKKIPVTIEGKHNGKFW